MLSLLLLAPLFLSGQNIDRDRMALEESFRKISEWTYDKYGDASSDSIEKFNDDFEALLLKLLVSNPQTLTANFEKPETETFGTDTAPDGNLRIYSWDDRLGGTMRYFRNVFQYKVAGKVYATVFKKPDTDTDNQLTANDYMPVEIHNVVSENKTYYLLYRIFIGSSAAYQHQVKVFSIDGEVLNDKAKLIKTQSGIQNELTWDIDFSSEVNRTKIDRELSYMQYDEPKKIISIPLIAADGKLTKKRIRYQFKGKYFEKI